jgi:hypothetical protein
VANPSAIELYPGCVEPTPTPTNTQVPTATLPAIGGAGAFPDIGGTDASGGSAGLLGGIAGGTAAAVALGGAAWYAKRRPQ